MYLYSQIHTSSTKGDNLDLEQHMIELTRRGQEDKVRYIKNLDRSLLPSQKQRIINHDTSVWHELVVPNWLTFDMLREYIITKDKPQNAEMCTFCNSAVENPLNLNGKNICRDCAEKIRGMI
jgi:formylmethanofuran dehydrogenase subunit E